MQYFKNTLLYALLVILLLTQSCIEKKRIIEQDKFSLIISEMYLADQYIESHPQYRAQADTMLVYNGIFKKYGYTLEDYYNSVEYYLQKGGLYKKLHSSAREILVQRESELKKLIDLKRGISIEWWATDTIKKMPIKELYNSTYLRSIKWITMPSDTIIWRITDSAIVDIPQNNLWWQRNIDIVFNDSIVTKYNILTKEYRIKLEQDVYEKPINLKGDTINVKKRVKPINKEAISKMQKQTNNPR